MSSQMLWGTLIGLVLTLLLSGTLAATPSPEFSAAAARTVPRASCGPHDQTESGLQGQTTLAERFRLGPSKAYNCNLERVGQFEGEGASAGMVAFEDCAYYSIIRGPKTQHPGVAVVDVSDAAHPNTTTYLDSPAMAGPMGPFESLTVSAGRKLLAASNMAARDPTPFDLYDISDCRHPVLKSSAAFPGLYSHSGEFSSDGQVYYGSKWPLDPKDRSVIFVIDVSHPSSPRLLLRWYPDPSWITHSIVVSSDGKRAYVSIKRMVNDQTETKNPNGLAILDVSDIQAHRSKPQIRLVSTLFWEDTHGSEGMQLVTLQGKRFLTFSDNQGAIDYQSPRPGEMCASGRPSYGFARIIDLSDEMTPRTASTLMLEADAPANCTQVVHDSKEYGAYGSYACIVDNPENGRLLACASWQSGLRVFDIRDPVHPKEVAYYKPSARRSEVRPGSLLALDPHSDRTTDPVITFPRFRKGGTEIWLTSVQNGFQVLRFEAPFVAAHRDLFQ